MGPDFAIVNGILVDSQDSYPGVIYVREGKIAGITRALEHRPSQILDARGLHVLPGAVDGHVHMMDPGYPDREDFTTGTKAAARGGVTTVIDHHRTVPPVFGKEELRQKKEYLEKRSVVDFGLLGGLSLTNLANLQGLWEEGALGFKGFTCELHEADALTAGPLTEILEEIHRFGGIALFHCEEDSMVKKKESILREQGRKDPLLIPEWRSPEAEELAALTVLYAARKTGARVAIAHVSLHSILAQIARAKADGFPVYAETCPQYATVTTEDLKIQGPFLKFTPPVRTPADVEKMRWSLGHGLVDMVNSDHCPYPRADKEAGLNDIWQAPFGIPGVETVTPLLLDGVAGGWLTLPQLVSLRSERPAAIYGLSGQKGALKVGCDADIIFVDLARKRKLENGRIVSKCGWTPYDGMTVSGDIALTMVRGRIVMNEGEVTGEPGWGRFVTRRG
jgi:dihydroorotase (multifunctional complex type)